ncbi:hypothetical protein FKM82_025952 [Ascaphus truei]
MPGTPTSTFCPFKPPEMPKSPPIFGPFKFTSKSGSETFGDEISSEGPFRFPTNSGILRSGASTSMLANPTPHLNLDSGNSVPIPASGPSTEGPEIPNVGMLNLGILIFPPEPDTSMPGEFKFRFPETPISPLIFGPFKFKSISGVVIFGTGEPIETLGPLRLTSGAPRLRSRLGALTSPPNFGPDTSMSSLGSERSAPGNSTFGPDILKVGSLNLGFLAFISGPSMPTPGEDKSISGVFNPLPISKSGVISSALGLCREASPFNLGDLMSNSTSGKLIFPKRGLRVLGAFMPMGDFNAVSPAEIFTSISGAFRFISPSPPGTLTSNPPFFPLILGPLM